MTWPPREWAECALTFFLRFQAALCTWLWDLEGVGGALTVSVVGQSVLTVEVFLAGCFGLDRTHPDCRLTLCSAGSPPAALHCPVTLLWQKKEGPVEDPHHLAAHWARAGCRRTCRRRCTPLDLPSTSGKCSLLSFISCTLLHNSR